MSTLLVRQAALLITLDDERRVIADGALFVRDNVIERVGLTADLTTLVADRVIDARGEGRAAEPG